MNSPLIDLNYFTFVPNPHLHVFQFVYRKMHVALVGSFFKPQLHVCIEV